MSIGIKDFRMAIRMDNAQAKKALIETKEQIKALREELDKMAAEGKKNTEEYKAKQAALDKLNRQYQEQQRQAGLTAMSYNDLSKNARTLRQMMQNAIPQSGKWKEYRNELVLVEKRMAELRRSAHQTKSTLEKFNTGYTKIAAIGTAVAIVTSKVVNGINRIMEERNKLESSSANVKALTGLDDTDVMKLQENARKMSSALTEEGVRIRQSAVEINDSFAIVGSQRPELLKDAEALRRVTQDAIYLSIAGKEELEPSTKAVTNSMNQFNLEAQESRRIINVLAAGSQAGAAGIGYLSQAVEKAGTTANLMGISFEQTVGVLEAVAPKFTDASVAGNSLDKVLLKLKEKQIGYKDGTFDLNRAIEELENRYREGDSAAKIFGVEHAKMGEILVANKSDIVEYTDAVTGTNKAVEQAVINSDTMEGRLKQAKNALQNARIELGEQLVPAVVLATDTLTSMVRLLPKLLSFLKEWGPLIVQLTLWIGLYTTALNASIAADKLKVLWNGRIVASLKRLYATLLAHPYMAVGAAVIIFIDTIRRLNKELSLSEKLEKHMSEIRSAAIRNIRMEKSEVEQMLAIARNENASKGERLAAIRRLNEISPEYLGNLTLEKINTEEATKAVNSYIDSLLLKQEIELANSKKHVLLDQREDVLKNGATDVSDKFLIETAKMVNSAKKLFTGFEDDWATETIDKLANKGVNKLQEIDAQVKALDDFIEESRQKLIRQRTGNIEVDADGLTEEERKRLAKLKEEELEKQAKEREEALKKEYKRRTKLMKSQQLKEINLLKDDYINKEMSENEFQEKLYSLIVVHLGERKALMEEFGEDATAIQGQIYDKIIAETKRKLKELEKLHKESMKMKVPDEEVDSEVDKDSDALVNMFNEDTIKQIESNKKIALDILEAFYEAGLISKEAYEKAKDKIEEEHHWTRAEKAKKSLEEIANFAGSMSQLYQALQDKEISKVNRKYDKEIKAAKKAGKDTTKLEEEKETAVNAIKKKYADKQFSMAVLQIMATTAIAAMEAYASLAKIPFVGPALATIAMASALAAGAAQLITAKQARDEAKGLKKGGYSDEYVEGYTISGNPDDVAGVIPVHKNEFVGNHEGVANPHVKQFYDIFDVAQKNGTIRMINTTQILEQIKTRSGKYSGGYNTESGIGKPVSSDFSFPDNENGGEIKKVIILLTESNRLLTIISEKELAVDPRDIKKGLTKLEKLDANVSRRS